jgi:hypothetical protein
LRRLLAQLVEIASSWSTAPVIAAYQALGGVSFIVPATFVAEVGDVRRVRQSTPAHGFPWIRLEGARKTLHPLSTPDSRRQEGADHHRGHRARDAAFRWAIGRQIEPVC